MLLHLGMLLRVPSAAEMCYKSGFVAFEVVIDLPLFCFFISINLLILNLNIVDNIGCIIILFNWYQDFSLKYHSNSLVAHNASAYF